MTSAPPRPVQGRVVQQTQMTAVQKPPVVSYNNQMPTNQMQANPVVYGNQQNMMMGQSAQPVVVNALPMNNNNVVVQAQPMNQQQNQFRSV